LSPGRNSSTVFNAALMMTTLAASLVLLVLSFRLPQE
jgi:hypothetical protein